MLGSDFGPVTLPAITTDLIEIDGSSSEDFNIVFAAATNHTDELVLFQQDNDLLKWIFEKLKEDKNVS
jgi:hypothetical protein